MASYAFVAARTRDNSIGGQRMPRVVGLPLALKLIGGCSQQIAKRPAESGTRQFELVHGGTL